MDQSFGARMFGCNNEVAGIQSPRIARFHCTRLWFIGSNIFINQHNKDIQLKIAVATAVVMICGQNFELFYFKKINKITVANYQRMW